MKRLLAGCFLLVLCVCSRASGEEGLQDSLLDHMTGQWVLQGTIAGKETTHDVNVDWVLNHEYIRFQETSREKDAKGRAAYEAIVFIGWDQKLSQYACLWLDTTDGGGLAAAQAIAHGKRSGNEIAFLFNGEDGSSTHTKFVYNSDPDTWQWIMDNEEHGTMRPFARLTLKRK
jgi:hypothetical protein